MEILYDLFIILANKRAKKGFTEMIGEREFEYPISLQKKGGGSGLGVGCGGGGGGLDSF